LPRNPDLVIDYFLAGFHSSIQRHPSQISEKLPYTAQEREKRPKTQLNEKYGKKYVLFYLTSLKVSKEQAPKHDDTENIFSGIPPSPWISTTSLLNRCQILMKATRFEQVRTFRQWLLPVFKKALTKLDSHFSS
jgi:hypothetical protein